MTHLRTLILVASSLGATAMLTAQQTDLRPTEFTANLTKIWPGATVKVSSTIQNRLITASAITQSAYFLSKDSYFSSHDTLLQTFQTPRLGLLKKATHTASIRWTSTVQGAHYIGVFADYKNTVREKDESNNTLVRRLFCHSKPDYVVSNLTVSSTTWLRGNTISVGYKVTNSGSPQIWRSTDIEFYLSKDNTISNDDYKMYTTKVYGLGHQGSVSASKSIYIRNMPISGECYLIAVVNRLRDFAETNYANNAAALRGNCVQVPDLQLETFDATSRTWIRGTPVTLSGRVVNVGTAEASVQTGFFLSKDSTITTSDYMFGFQAASKRLGPGQRFHHNYTVPLPSRMPFEGACYMGAFVDFRQTITEINESNNKKTIQGTCSNDKLDLTITELTASTTTWTQGAQVQLTVKTENTGSANAAASNTGVFMSNDATITTSDRILSRISVPSLNAGKAHRIQRAVRIPSITQAGKCWIGAYADYKKVLHEASETNNTKSIEGTCAHLPDLTVASIRKTAGTIAAGNKIDLEVTIENKSLARSGAFQLVLKINKSGALVTPSNGMKLHRSSEFRNGLSPNGRMTMTVRNCVIPHFFEGNSSNRAFICAYVDHAAEVRERDESNNYKGFRATCPSYTASGRQFEIIPKVFPRLGTLTTFTNLGLQNGLRTVRYAITAPERAGHYYLMVWHTGPAVRVDPMTEFALGLLNTPVMPRWFGRLGARGRTSLTNGPKLDLPKLTIPSRIVVYGSAIFFKPDFSGAAGLTTSQPLLHNIRP